MASTTVSFSSFNLYNLNVPGLRIYTNENGWTQSEYDEKITWSASIIKSLKSDIWGFQELWHHEALTDIFNKSGLLNEYELLINNQTNGRKIVCSGAVRKGLLDGNHEWIEDFPDKFILHSGGDDPQTEAISVKIGKFSRPILHFSIKPKANSKSISVYVCHFKSKSPTKVYKENWYKADEDYYKNHSESLGAALSTIRRTVEATALRMLLTEKIKNNDNPVVILGDLNDNQHSNTLNILTGQPRYLSALSQGGSDTDLYMAGTLQEYRSLRDVYYTHIHQDIKESLDHILFSQEFYDNSKKRIWVFDGLSILNDHLNEDDHKINGTSDHGVIKVKFKYKPHS